MNFQMNGHELTQIFLVVFVVAIAIFLGRRAVEALRTGALRVYGLGGSRVCLRRYHPKEYWFWMICHLAAVIASGPYMVYAIMHS
jgi:uncharacterized membrane protein YhaH (DUF805 family)